MTAARCPAVARPAVVLPAARFHRASARWALRNAAPGSPEGREQPVSLSLTRWRHVAESGASGYSADQTQTQVRRHESPAWRADPPRMPSSASLAFSCAVAAQLGTRCACAPLSGTSGRAVRAPLPGRPCSLQSSVYPSTSLCRTVHWGGRRQGHRTTGPVMGRGSAGVCLLSTSSLR
jgi:hypothetical protein